MKSPQIHLITDGTISAESFDTDKNELLRIVEAGRSSGISHIHIREKNLNARLQFDLVRELAAISKARRPLIFVNGRPDVAETAGADGVHLPSHSFTVKDIKKNFPRLQVGISVHSVKEAASAEVADADHVYLSPIYASPGKGEPLGLDRLSAAVKAADVPMIALGGIDESRVQAVLATGAAGFAAIRYLNEFMRARIKTV